MKIFIYPLLCLSLFLLTTGCKPVKKEVEISGSATVDGQPIDLGIVQFFNDTTEGGGNVQEGKYTASVPTGELTVRIRGYRWTGPEPEVPEQKPGDAPTTPPQRPRESITSEALWQSPTLKVTIDKPGVYDLQFEN